MVILKEESVVRIVYHLYAVVASIESFQRFKTVQVSQRPESVLLNVKFLQLQLTHERELTDLFDLIAIKNQLQ